MRPSRTASWTLAVFRSKRANSGLSAECSAAAAATAVAPDARRAAEAAVTARDQLGGLGEQIPSALEDPHRQADAPRDVIVEVDRRAERLVTRARRPIFGGWRRVGRGILERAPEVPWVAHEGERRHQLEGMPEAPQTFDGGGSTERVAEMGGGG